MVNIQPYIENKKHVIWDWNGTLLNDLDSVLAALSKIADKIGAPQVSRETYLKYFRFPVAEFYKDIGFYKGEAEFEALSEDFHKFYDEAIHMAELFSGTYDVLTSVKERGSKQSILTAAFQKHIDLKLEVFKINHLFDHVFGQNNKLAVSKLDRGRELMALAQVSPAETILIGDTSHDFEVGEALGIDVVLVTDGHSSAERLHDTHHVVFKRKG